MSSIRIGVTGHRALGDAAAWVSDALRDLLREHSGEVVAISAIAVGADTLFAEAALELGMRLEVVIPYDGYVKDFPAGAVRERYESLLAAAAVVHRMLHTSKCAESYMTAGQWIVDHCDLLVAVYDGRPPEKTGGTADVVEYARMLGKRLCHFNPETRELALHDA